MIRLSSGSSRRNAATVCRGGLLLEPRHESELACGDLEHRRNLLDLRALADPGAELVALGLRHLGHVPERHRVRVDRLLLDQRPPGRWISAGVSKAIPSGAESDPRRVRGVAGGRSAAATIARACANGTAGAPVARRRSRRPGGSRPRRAAIPSAAVAGIAPDRPPCVAQVEEVPDPRADRHQDDEDQPRPCSCPYANGKWFAEHREDAPAASGSCCAPSAACRGAPAPGRARGPPPSRGSAPSARG